MEEDLTRLDVSKEAVILRCRQRKGVSRQGDMRAEAGSIGRILSRRGEDDARDAHGACTLSFSAHLGLNYSASSGLQRRARLLPRVPSSCSALSSSILKNTTLSCRCQHVLTRIRRRLRRRHLLPLNTLSNQQLVMLRLAKRPESHRGI